MRYGRLSTWCFLLFAAILVGRSSRGQETVASYDAACATCHAAVYRAYLGTPSARASGPAASHLIPGQFTNRQSSVHYSVSGDKGNAVLRFTDELSPGADGERRLTYYLGSGHLGVTYLYAQRGYLLESPIAWYARTAGYDMAPGFGRLTEMPPALPMEPNCLRCHMSGVAQALPGTINRYAALPFQQTGITCERCHGDGSAHVRTGGRAAILNPSKLEPVRRDSLCMSCHLEGDVAVDRENRHALDFRAGDRLGEFLSYFVFASKDPLSRGVSEVEQFAASRCKEASGDRMSCTSCHDPHVSPASAERVAFYRAKCLACHTAPAFARTHHSEQPDCTRCHMPRSSAQDIPHVAWTDHRILRVPEQALPSAAADRQGAPLIPVLSPEASERDAAIAMYIAFVRGESVDRSQALARLKRVYAARSQQGSTSQDTQLLEALGVLSGISGDAEASEQYLRKLLSADPLNLTGIADLGVLLTRQGKYQAAVELWAPAFARNQDLIGLARNLAVGQCAMGDDIGAQATIHAAAMFSPGVRSLATFHCGN